ncbi:hypothetical protein RDABS01_033822 [Bienertia sinuspersici]
MLEMRVMDCGMMGLRVGLFLALICIRIGHMVAQTNERDRAALVALTDGWENLPPSWTGSDPCGRGWEGITCSDSRIVGIFTGEIPGTIGNLRKLYWLDLADNRLTGSIPVSSGDTPGLDLLLDTKHLLFDNNKLTGSIPDTLGLVSTLEAIRFDRNDLNGDLPPNIGNLTHVDELVMSNNALSGPIPDLSGMSSLQYLDLSNNTFNATEFPEWLVSLQSLTTLMMDGTNIEGQIPEDLFDIPQLQTVTLRNNRINGTFEIGSSYSKTLQLIDLQNNSIIAATVEPGNNFTLMLADNPFCDSTAGVSFAYCNNEQDLGSRFSTPVSCVVPKCSSEQVSSPTCRCAYPFTGTLQFRAPSTLGSSNLFSQLQKDLVQKLGNFNLPVESIALSDVTVDGFGYLNVELEIFPAGQDYFNRTGVFSLGFVFSNQTYKPPAAFGAGGYAYYQKKRVTKAKQQANPFVSWNEHGTDGDVPQLKGARFFTFEELQKCTNNFSEANTIGSGGYGKVYKGILADGRVLAIKRSQQGSMQGSREFKNEIELLSRVHHRNLAKLVGFCFDKGEQTLVYEFIPNGTLMESLLGTSGIYMDWIRRLIVTLGSARGLHYLHELADPPIIHRDIKSNNILLDERLNAKVADFGLSKLFGDTDQKGYVTTQVKGTMGYLDPEYFMTNQLTEKSDIFSFGVVMLEMVTARRPIQDGKYIVREIKEVMDRSKDLYNLHSVIDPSLIQNTTMLVGLEKYVDLALKCVQEEGINRPTMGEVVKEVEQIVQLAGMNPNADSTPPSSQSHENTTHPYYDNSLFEYSGSVPSARAEPK